MTDFRKTELDPKAPVIECKVPRGALLKDGDDIHVLNTVTMRELTGHEEDILANKNIDVTVRLHRIVGNCLLSVSDGEGNLVEDPKVLKTLMTSHPLGFLMGDSLVLMFRLREVTVGDEYRQKVTCPSCKTDDGDPFSWTHIGSMKDLEVIPAKGNPAEYARTFTTERGNVIEWEMLTAHKEAQHTKQKLSKNKATRALMLRAVSLNGEAASLEKLKDLSLLERQDLRKEFNSEGGIDTDLPVLCRNCGHEFKVGFDIDPQDFFSRLEASKT